MSFFDLHPEHAGPAPKSAKQRKEDIKAEKLAFASDLFGMCMECTEYHEDVLFGYCKPCADAYIAAA